MIYVLIALFGFVGVLSLFNLLECLVNKKRPSLLPLVGLVWITSCTFWLAAIDVACSALPSPAEEIEFVEPAQTLTSGFHLSGETRTWPLASIDTITSLALLDLPRPVDVRPLVVESEIVLDTSRTLVIGDGTTVWIGRFYFDTETGKWVDSDLLGEDAP